MARKDGKKIYPKDPEHILMPYLMRTKHESEVYLNQEIDITGIINWVDEKNKTSEYRLTFFNVLIGVVAKTIYSRPKLNHFIKNGSFYERHDVSMAFVAKDKLSDDAAEKLIVYKAKENDTPLEIAENIVKYVHRARSSGNESEELYFKIASLPKPILKLVGWGAHLLDKRGFLPNEMMENDFNFATVLLSNLGSIKCRSAYHHLNEYGTNSIVITIGTIYEEDGRYKVDIGATLDERIADGFYFAKSLKLVEYISSHPELLDEEVGKKVEIVH